MLPLSSVKSIKTVVPDDIEYGSKGARYIISMVFWVFDLSIARRFVMIG